MPKSLRNSLPGGASLEHLRKQAKDLHDAAARDDVSALSRIRTHLHAKDWRGALKLSQAQHVIARDYGFESWPKLKVHVETRAAARARVEELKQRIWTRADDMLRGQGSLVDPRVRDGALRERWEEDVPFLPVRDWVLFPGACAPIVVARPRSLAMVEALGPKTGGLIAVFCQLAPEVEWPTEEDLQQVGVLAHVYEVVPVPDEPTVLFLEGLQRVRLEEITRVNPYGRVRVGPWQGDEASGAVAGMVDELRSCARKIITLTPGAPNSAQSIMDRIVRPHELVDAIATNLDAPQEVKGALLAADSLEVRLRRLLDLLRAQLAVLEARQRAVS